MAYFNSIVTTAGAALLTDVMANGGEVNIIAAAIGTGTPSGDPAEITALITPASEGETTLHDKYISQGATNTLVIPVDVSNLGLTAELPIREIGIFAQGETGRVLFAYSWFEGEDGSNILPVPKDPTAADAVHSFEIGVFVTNQEAAAVTVTVSDAAYISADQKGKPYGVAALDGNGGILLDDILRIAKGHGAFVTDEASTIIEHRKDDSRFGFVVYPDMDIAERYKVFEDINGIIRQHDLYGTHNVHMHKGQTVSPSSIELHPEKGADHGGYIDFHFGGDESDLTSRIIEEDRGVIGITGVISMHDAIGQSPRKGYFLQWYGHTHVRNYADDNNFSEIILKPDDVTPTVLQNKNGVVTEHQILHTGNSPAVVATAELI